MEHFDERLVGAILSESLKSLGIAINKEAQSKLIAYLAILLEGNERINLISSKQDLRTKVIIHLVDSLTPLMWSDWPTGKVRAMDFGSGGGLPAIPLSIALPECLYTLIESTGKKASFLAEARKALALDNVMVMNTFLEPGKNAENCFYDVITARGVSDLKSLFSIAGPRLPKGGFFIAFKGPQGEQELKDSSAERTKRNMVLFESLAFKLPFVEAERRLYIFQKL